MPRTLSQRLFGKRRFKAYIHSRLGTRRHYQNIGYALHSAIVYDKHMDLFRWQIGALVWGDGPCGQVVPHTKKFSGLQAIVDGD